MKYQVQISYTNPAHDHVSLRRRVDTITRLVEARNEQEALNRAANQQRALGYLIREAKVVQPKVLAEEIEQMAEGSKTPYRNINSPESRAAAEKQKKQMARDDAAKPGKELLDKIKKRGVAEEVEQEAEGYYVMGKSQSVSWHPNREEAEKEAARLNMRGGTNHTVQSAARTDGLKKEEIEQMDEARYQVVGKTKENETFKSKIYPTKKEALDAHYKMSKSGRFYYPKNRRFNNINIVKVTEEVEQVDEANMRFDPEAAARPTSRDVKNFQNRNTNRRAGALTKKYIRRMTKLGGLGPNQTKKDTERHMMDNFAEEVEQIDEKLTASDPASKWISDFVKSENPKFEGKSKKERINMALGAYYAAKGNKNEEVEQVDEVAGWMLKRDPKLAAKLAANVKKAKRMNYLMRKYGGKTGEEIANMDAEEKAKKAINEVEGLLPKQKAVADRLKRHELAKNQQKAGNKYGRAVKAAKLAAKRKKTADTEPKLHDIQVHNSTNGVNDQ